MKTRLAAALLSLAFASAVLADDPAAPPIAADSSRLTADQLEQLLGPIALYPDALIAIILPASTAPADIVLAVRYLKDNGDPAEVSSRSWDESVKSLVHYPEVVKWMDDNLSWTKQLGEAFREQPAEVMQAIQRLRAKARAAGTLVDSPQQQIVVDSDVITIVPAQVDTLYVPYYDPLVVYAPRPAYYYGTTSFITFSSPFAVGAWLNFDCDWHHRTVWTGDRRRWVVRDNHDWRRPVFPGQPGYVRDPNRHPWNPPANQPRMPIVNNYRRGEIARPAPINAAPAPAFAQTNRPDWRNDSPNRPQRNDSRNREINFANPAPVAPVAAATQPAILSAAAPAPAATQPSNRRGDFNRDRYNSNDRSNRPIAFQNPPGTPPVATGPAPIVQAPPATSNYPFGHAPSSHVVPAINGPIVPAFAGPVVQSMPQPAATQPQQMRWPTPAPAPAAAIPPPAPAPTTPPAQTPADDRRRGGNDGDRNRPQQQPE